ncbi:MAG: crossover junction endodeoxyribonuclease RuvC [Longimicrobiales bacterium]
MKVIGVDPGTAATGYGVVVRQDGGAVSLAECGVIRTDSAHALPERLRAIFDGVSQLLERHRPDVVAVEDVFYGRNVRTTIVLGHARAAVILAAALRNIAVAEYPASEVKNAVVGRGRANKEQVQYMVQHLLRLREPPRPSDAADGVAVALCHCTSARLDRGPLRVPSDAELLRRAASFRR